AAEARVGRCEQRGERRVLLHCRLRRRPTHRVETHIRDLRIRHRGFRSRVQLEATLRDGLGEDLQCRYVRASKAQERLERAGTGIAEDLPERAIPVATEEQARGDGIERQGFSGACVDGDLLGIVLEYGASRHTRHTVARSRYRVYRRTT